MKTLRMIGIAALAAGMLQSATAYAAVTATLVFTNPTGTVNANDTIDIGVRLTLDAGSDPLTYNASDPFPNGVAAGDIPTEGYSPDLDAFVPFATYDYINSFIGRSCDDTFTIVCRDPGSQYEYAVPGTNSWFDFSGTINPGDSMDFTLYTLTPVAGGAAPGTYDLFTGGFGLFVVGEDAAGTVLREDIYRFDTTCSDANCTFSRTVSAVPLPAAAWLFGSALLGLAGVARRKRA